MKMMLPCTTLDLTLPLYLKAVLISIYSPLPELSTFPGHLQLFLCCFFSPTLITYSTLQTAFSYHIPSLFLKQIRGNLIFLMHLYTQQWHLIKAGGQPMWKQQLCCGKQVKQYIKGAEHTYKGDSKSGQHYG